MPCSQDFAAFFDKDKHPEYDFLSNFYPCAVDGFACSEGLYQYQKFAYLEDTDLKMRFQKATGKEAWELSRELKDRIDPQFNRLTAMKHALTQKFSESSLKEKLLATGRRYLVENCPHGHDSFWADNGDGTGQNMLGKLLMQERKVYGGFGEAAMPPILQVFYSKTCKVCHAPCHFNNKGIVYSYCQSHLKDEKDAVQNSNLDIRLYRFFSQSPLPTRYGPIHVAVFKHCSLDQEAIALIADKTLQSDMRKEILVRVHDACMTSETFSSLKCDCQLQLEQAFQAIQEHGGMVIYLKQEGRGIGLANKIAAYNLQETCHLDTVDANRELGLPDDMREYSAVRDILHHFDIESIILMSNNKRKKECLTELGIEICGMMPCIVEPKSEQMKHYMRTKVDRMGHDIPLELIS